MFAMAQFFLKLENNFLQTEFLLLCFTVVISSWSKVLKRQNQHLVLFLFHIASKNSTCFQTPLLLYCQKYCCLFSVSYILFSLQMLFFGIIVNILGYIASDCKLLFFPPSLFFPDIHPLIPATPVWDNIAIAKP